MKFLIITNLLYIFYSIYVIRTGIKNIKQYKKAIYDLMLQNEM